MERMEPSSKSYFNPHTLESISLDQLDEDESLKLAAAQTNSFYNRSAHWLLPSLIAGALMGYALYGILPFEMLGIWLAAVGIISLLQGGLILLFNKSNLWRSYHQRWRIPLSLSWLLLGACWGAGSMWLLPQQPTDVVFLAIIILLGFVIAIVPPLAIHQPTAIGFLALSLGPSIVLMWQFSASDTRVRLAHILLVIFVGLIALARHISGAAARSLRMKIENQMMLNNAEVLNESLKDEIKERWRVEQELKKAKEEAEVAARTKGDFLATMSHEIRTPMNGVLGMLELLKEMEMGPEQRELVNTAHYSAESLLGIINDVLDFSKIEMGELELENIEFNLPRTIKDVSALMKRRAEEKNIYVRVEPLDAGVPTTILGDPTRLRQVLINLVGNAVKFTEEGGVSVRVVLLRRSPRSVVLRFEVRDTGIGISEAAQQKLFQPFSQADSSMARRYGGTGLGLSIARHLVNLMGGQIGVESRLGEGSLFWFTVPFNVPHQAQMEVRSNIEGTRILLIGAESVERKAIEQALLGYRVNLDIASNFNEALAKMTQLASIGKSWLYEAVILSPSLVDANPQHFISQMGKDVLLSSIAIIAFDKVGAETQRQGLTTEVAAWLAWPLNERQLFLAIAENTTGVGAGGGVRVHEEMEVLVEDIPTLDQDDLPSKAGRSGKTENEHAGKGETTATPKDVEMPDFSGCRVLVAEDNKVNQKVAQRMLTKTGVRVDVAENGQEAVEMQRRHRYDLIFMDCQMPDVNGIEATRAIREQEEQLGEEPVPIIAMTANAMEGDREFCLSVGMTDYLPKPVKQDALNDMLARYLKPKKKTEAPMVPSSTTPSVVAQRHILLVEDNPINQQVAKRLLGKMGFFVTTANDGFEGVEAVQKDNFQAILMDCQMPGMDGYEATRKIRQWEASQGKGRTPIIAVTANAMEGDRERCLDSGMDDYLPKPIKRDSLANMLSKWLPEGVTEDLEEANMSDNNLDSEKTVDSSVLDELQELMEDDFTDLVTTYLKDTPKLLLQIRDAIKSGDDDTLRSTAHTLKSSSANMGVMHLSALAKEMELLGRSGTTKGAASLFNQSIAEFKRAKAILETRI